jgi:hypothetical protein
MLTLICQGYCWPKHMWSPGARGEDSHTYEGSYTYK